MKKRALFVGVDEYADGSIARLEHAVADAEALAAVFETLLGFKVDRLRNPAGKKDILRKVREVSEGLEAGDLFFFFFAGHGFRVKENYVLVCKEDMYADLEDEYDGLPVGQLKKQLRGPWDRMLVIDACQNDIRKSRGADGGWSARDLALVKEDCQAAGAGEGSQVVVTSCSEGQKALEVGELGHGLFTWALLETVKDRARGGRRLDVGGLREEMGKQMGALAERYRLGGKQNPVFVVPGNCGIVLLEGEEPDGEGGEAATRDSGTATAAPAGQVCESCGEYRLLTDMFRCRQCKKWYCKDKNHRDEETWLCVECAEERKKEKAAEEAAKRRAEEEAKAADEGRNRSGDVVRVTEEVSPALAKCGKCGTWRLLTDMFECKKCGKQLCTTHQDKKTFLCLDCAEAAGAPKSVAPKPAKPRKRTKTGDDKVPKTAGAAKSGDLAEAILKAIQSVPRLLGKQDFHAGTNIPPRKEANFKQACVAAGVPVDDAKLLALIDGTVFGSCKTGMGIGLKGIYTRNDWAANKVASGFVPWKQLVDHEQAREMGASEVMLLDSSNVGFNRSGSQVEARDVIDLVKSLKRAVAPFFGEEGDGEAAGPEPEETGSEIGKTVLAVCMEKAKTGNKIYVKGGIPVKKAANFVDSCEAAGVRMRDREFLALIDGTVFGSCKTGMGIGLKGIYTRNDWAANKVASGFVPWKQLVDHGQVREVGAHEIALLDSSNVGLNCSGSEVEARDVVDLVKSLKRAVEPFFGEEGDGEAADPEPEEDGSEIGKAVLAVCMDEAMNGKKIFVKGNIPEKKAANFRGSCAASGVFVPDREFLALIDGTVFGSCKNGVGIGESGICTRNDWAAGTVKSGFVSWRDLALDGDVRKVAAAEVAFFKMTGIECSGCDLGSNEMIDLFKKLKKAVEPFFRQERQAGEEG